MSKVSLLVAALVFLTGCSGSKAPPNTPTTAPAKAPAKDLPEPALKFRITVGVFEESAIGGRWNEKEIRIQSENDDPITILAVVANRKYEWRKASTIRGAEQLPLVLDFGDAIYVGAWSAPLRSGVIEVLIRTDRGDFKTQ